MNSLDFKTQALVLHKTPFRDRDLVVKLISQSGSLMSVLFYGGRGGGVKKKSSLVEVGHCLNLNLRKSSKLENNLLTAKEWSLKWSPNHIRLNHTAFYLMSFFSEIFLKLGQEAHDYEEDEHKELYIILSNALFYLDESVQQSDFKIYAHLSTFLSKLIYQLGISPDYESCYNCSKELKNDFTFNVQNGVFSCCENEGFNKSEFESAFKLYRKLKSSFSLKYPQSLEEDDNDYSVSKNLFHFFCYQYQFNPSNYKSYSLVF